MAPALSGPGPLYYHLQQAIRERLASGEWACGDQLPTFRELCETYGVSRITVVQAIGNLAREGLVTRSQGRGVFVSEPKVPQGPLRLMSFTEETLRRGQRSESRQLALRLERASVPVAARLEISARSPVVMLKRLRLSDRLPMGLQTAYLPAELFPGLAEARAPIESLYGHIEERYGIVPTFATDRFSPVVLDEASSHLLSCPTGAPGFHVERLTLDQRRRPIELVYSTLRGDLYQVVLELERGRGL